LHGQHHGQWLLNATGELNKVKNTVPKLFERICDRTWIIIGYSGEDELLDEIAKIGSFENELYWIGYKNIDPIEKVKERLLSDSNKNAYLISGYDSDSFFLKLHSELKLETPEIFNKPFSFLKSMIENVKDIEEQEDGEHKDLFKNVKERMEISNEWVHKAIIEIENQDSVEKFKQEIIEAILKRNFNDKTAKIFLDKIELNDNKDANIELSSYFNSWGLSLMNAAKLIPNERVYNNLYEKFKKATELNPNNDSAFNNWGCALSNYARNKNEKNLYTEIMEKFQKAVSINKKNEQALDNIVSNHLFHSAFFPEKKRKEILLEAKEKAIKNYNLYSKTYNLACTYALLEEKNEAFKYLEESLKKKQISINHVEKDNDWDNYKDDPDFIKILLEYKLNS
jgi:tetratricopeptide (TPR) repeat protein